MKKSIFAKVFSGYLLITVMLSGTILFFSFEKIRDYHLSALTEELKGQGFALRPAIVPMLEKGQDNGLNALVKNLDGQIHARITIIDSGGKVIADSKEDPRVMENHGNRPEVIEAMKSDFGKSLRFSTTVGEKMLYVAVPVNANGRRIGIIRTSFFVKDINSFLDKLQLTIISITLVTSAVSLVFALLFSRSILKPIITLKSAANRIASGDFNATVSISNKDEFKELGGSFNYMTERIRSLFEEISRQKTELNAIIASLQEGLAVIGKDEKIAAANDAFKKITGQNEIDGRFYWEIIRETSCANLIKKAFKEKKNTSCEIDVGSGTCLFSVNYVAVNEEIVVVLHDITEIKRLEKIKKDFAANVSHEMRTPLSAIKGYAETLYDSLDGKNRHYVEIIQRSTERLINIVSDLLLLSEMEEKGFSISLEKVSFRELFESVVSIFSQRIATKGLSLDVKINDDVPEISADRFKLEQLFINLIDNAVKYTEKGNITINVSKNGGNVRLDVSDSGIGISREDIERIFERFYVVDKSRSRQTGGTGLGLSIVKHIVLLHNGAINVTSTPAAGTTFTITLPIIS